MKIRKWAAAGMLLATVALLVLSGCASSPAGTAPVIQVAGQSQQTGIWVTGEGKVAAAPDVAIITLGINAQSKTVSEAQAQASDAMNRVMKALTDSGVNKDKDIQTQRFSISQVTRWNKDTNTSEVIGYAVSNMVIAKVRDLNATGKVIDAVATAGGDLTRINSIGFSIDDPTPYYKLAREKALADALNRAKQIAGGMDLKLGKATYISEGSLYVPPARYKSFDNAMGASAAPMAPTPISAGELEVSLSLQAVFSIQ
jgi:uncharacterized protein YggE